MREVVVNEDRRTVLKDQQILDIAPFTLSTFDRCIDRSTDRIGLASFAHLFRADGTIAANKPMNRITPNAFLFKPA
ncbi:hypothetical protein NKI48_16290 [Mesorhizobium sp. M0644]|uniref:hypothetical protein n=1 Tax=Mesorhizobium sp. M0644 TaxID=2956979 RepID=UPI003335502E